MVSSKHGKWTEMELLQYMVFKILYNNIINISHLYIQLLF